MNYFVARNNQQYGPLTVAEIGKRLMDGTLTPFDLAWTQGWDGWQPISSIPGIDFSQIPPPLPPDTTPSPRTGCTDFPPSTSKPNIDLLDIAPIWKLRFEIFERIKWNEGMLKNYKNCFQLELSDRFRISFNIWAFLFGPFYYFAKGMWAKGLLIIGAAFLLALALDSLPPFWISAYCCAFANYDYYRLKVIGQQF